MDISPAARVEFARTPPSARAAPRRGPRYRLFGGTLETLATRPAGRGRLIVTPNADHLRLLSRSRALRRAYASADVVLNDSRALDRAFLRGAAFCLTGADLAPELLKRLDPGAGVVVVGYTASVEAALRAAFPALSLRFLNPSMGYIAKRGERRDLAFDIAAGAPACVLICTGAPQSEIFAAQLKRQGCDADILCCGSGLLFLAGESRRAPVWMQRLGGEWAWRFLREPRTRKRYVGDALFLLANLPALMRLRRTGAADFAAFTLACPGRTA